MKIDVEGYEIEVLDGAMTLLHDVERRPRVVFIEAHPFAWPELGRSPRDLAATVARAGYYLTTMDGAQLVEVYEYGEVIAIPK
jgi:hypothetical protein